MANHDILLDESGDLRLNDSHDIIPGDSLVQKINIHLRWFKGEWPFDETQGTDWFDTAFVKNPDLDMIEQMIAQIISSFDEISSVESVSVDSDPVERSATIVWKAATKEGETIESEVKLWGNITA